MIALYQKPAKTTKVLVGVFGMSKGQVFCGAGEGFQKRPFVGTYRSVYCRPHILARNVSYWM